MVTSDPMLPLKQPLLDSGVSRFNTEEECHSTLDAMYLSGNGYKYDIRVSLGLEDLRGLLKTPPSNREAARSGLTTLEVAVQQASFNELQEAHEARHIEPVPVTLNGMLTKGTLGLLMLLAVVNSSKRAIHAEGGHHSDGEAAEGLEAEEANNEGLHFLDTQVVYVYTHSRGLNVTRRLCMYTHGKRT